MQDRLPSGDPQILAEAREVVSRLRWAVAHCVFRAALLLIAATGVTNAQVNIDAYRDYFLVGQFGEVCTMCEVTVVCAAGDELPGEEQVPDGGDFTLYHLQTRTFWSQVSTIWEWFISNFRQDDLAARGHTRPVHVYTVTDGVWPAKEVIEARLILNPGVLEFGDYHIDRTNRAWQSAATGNAVGYCSRLPLWGTLEAIDSHTARGES